MAGVSLGEFADRISEVMPVIIKEFARRQVNELYKGKITLPQFLILELLYRQGESKMTALAQVMRVTTSAMTGIVERLVRDGYLIRVDDPLDRRIIKVKLTGKGHQLVKKINQQKLQMTLKIFGKISEKDRADYLRILLQIKEILSKENSVI